MTNGLRAAISSDIDTLDSIYKGWGCRRAGGYTRVELHLGLENFARFLEPYGVQATLFMVGKDFQDAPNQVAIRAMAALGHEIANHSLSHPQGFRRLTPAQQESEISGMEQLCAQVTGQRPVGFRSPGWNADNQVVPILLRRGYVYDSSVFPTGLTPLLKFLHWYAMRRRPTNDRTTLGPWSHMAAPLIPYRTDESRLDIQGDANLVEFPLTVSPIVRLPFFATFLLAGGWEVFRATYQMLKAFGRPIQFQFHLSDFVDYEHPDLSDQVPIPSDGVYVPQALRTPLAVKLTLFRRALDLIAQDYEFCTLVEWARQVLGQAPVPA